MSSTPRLLITRFAPHAQLLADSLNNIGCFAVAQPLLTVIAVDDYKMLDAFLSGQYDYVIAVSGNAVKYTQKMTTDWPIATYFSVGKSTQKELHDATSQPVYCPINGFTSEALLTLSQLQLVKGKRVLILRGKGGRDLLESSLRERGAEVDLFETYKRIKIDLNGHDLVINWQQALINGVIISSVEILNQLFVLVPKSFTSWICGLTFYVPSERVANRAKILGVQHIVLLPSLHTDQVVDFFNINNGNRIWPTVLK